MRLDFVVAESLRCPGLLTLRGVDGTSAKVSITASPFESGDRVTLVSRRELESLDRVSYLVHRMIECTATVAEVDELATLACGDEAPGPCPG